MTSQIEAELLAALAAVFEKHFGKDWLSEEISPESFYTYEAMAHAMREGA